MTYARKMFAALTMMTMVFSAEAMAEVRLPSLFTNHMVLQRDADVPVWGWAEPGEEVTVEFDGQSEATKADDQGKWKVTLKSLKVGEPRTLTVNGSNTVKIEDVLVGDVWICSGQSNMQWTVSRSKGSDLELAGATNENIRLLTVEAEGKQEPASDFDGAWEKCTPGTTANFSAVGYYFARRIQQTTDVPIGLIDNAWGGSSCETWIPNEKFEGKELYAPMMERWKAEEAKHDEAAIRAQFAKKHAAWVTQMEKAVAAGKPIPGWPRPGHSLLSKNRPANLYNSRVVPLMPFAIKGVIWYQGESNAGRAYQYRDMFPLMISTWREAWGQGDFPFYWVQLADFREEVSKPSESDWAELREAQTMTMDKLPNTGEAVIIDVGDGKDIHPIDKQTVGDRLARWALATQYGVKVAYKSPRMKDVKFSDGKAVVTFEHLAGGLMQLDDKNLNGFAVAGEDKKWHWATAKVKGRNQVELTCDEVANPVAVRYCWGNNPVCNLYNRASLPVTPFRTDDWPGVTAEAR